MKTRSCQYTFQIKQGQSMPYVPLEADNDDHFFQTVLPAWEKEKGFEHVKGTVTCAVTEYRKVPEPVKPKKTEYEPEYVGFC